LIVDSYDDFEKSYFESDTERYIEQRANAFAIELLMPLSSIERRKDSESIQEYIRTNMLRYGTSFTSTKFHLYCNKFITDYEMESLNAPENFVETTSSDEWKGEEDYTLDYFPLAIQENKKGIFSYWVAKSFSEKLISLDSASGFLGCETSEFQDAYQTIISLFSDDE
jgi:Zn-dependent peptidase ImmA (M78 family)